MSSNRLGQAYCPRCITYYAVGTSHVCGPTSGNLTANIVPSTPSSVPGITKENLPDNAQEDSGEWNFKDPMPTLHSTDDDRTLNNVMRHEYKVLTDDEKFAMKSVKDHALLFHQYLDALGSSRELSIAKTKIEEAAFWAVKHITG